MTVGFDEELRRVIRRQKRLLGLADRVFAEFDRFFDRANEAFAGRCHGISSSDRALSDRTAYQLSRRGGPRKTGGHPLRSTATDLMAGSFKPMVDKFVADDSVKLIVELPGFQKDGLKVTCNKRSMLIEAFCGGRLYSRRIKLPVGILPTTARASFKNGVLELSAERARQVGNEGSVGG